MHNGESLIVVAENVGQELISIMDKPPRSFVCL